MPIELRIMSEEPPVAKLKLALIGKEKNGKSWLAASGRRPVLVHDFDNRAEALQGKPGVYVISYVEPQWPKQPEAAQKFLDNIAKLEESLDLSDLGFKVPKGTIVRTNVVDSIQTMGKAFQGYALYGQKDIRREITFGGMKVFLPGGWDAWNAEMVPVENSVLRLLALPTDTTIILHETAEETPDSTSEKPRFTGRIGVFPVRYQRLIKYFNEVWRVKLTQSIGKDNKTAYLPKVYPLPNYEFDAASAMLVDQIEEPNILAMIAKHEQRFAQQPKELQSLPGTKAQLPAGVKI
jgi:inosine/xanthosine triphosphate pyrophosphatase family protein